MATEHTREILAQSAAHMRTENSRAAMGTLTTRRSRPCRPFRGMSGGPVFDTGNQLVGINYGELRGCTAARLYATTASSVERRPFSVEADSGHSDDCMHEVAKLLRVSLLAEYFWSVSNPEHPFGEFGRIIGSASAIPL